MAAETNDATFKVNVLDAAVPVLVDFWAPWCGPCRMVGPIVEKISGKVAEKAKVFKLNVDESPATASKYGIMSIPTVLIFKNGEISQQLVGVQTEETYLQALGV